MTTWQSNDDVRRDGGAEVAEFDDAPPAPDRPGDGDGDDRPAEDESGPGARERHVPRWPDAS